jgi:hypothetical protein
VNNTAAGGQGITPYRVQVHSNNGHNKEASAVFEDTVMLRRDNNNQLTLAEPVGPYRQSLGSQQQ